MKHYWRTCETCGEFGNFDPRSIMRHRCKPVFYARAQGSDHETVVHATDHGEAAERYVERLMHGGEYFRVEVREPTGQWRTFDVTVEAVPEFTAEEVDDSSTEGTS